MNRDELLWVLGKYFPGLFLPSAIFLREEVAAIIIDRLSRIEREPLTCTQLNQLLHMVGEAGTSEGFFKFYFRACPASHPYAVDKLLTEPAEPDSTGVSSLRQVRWGLHRFFVDGLLYFGNIRSAFQALRKKSHEEILSFFSAERFDSRAMAQRGAVLPFHAIPVDDRYLIAELACKAYAAPPNGAPRLIEQVLVDAYQESGGGKACISSLFDKDSPLAKNDPQAQMMLKFTTEEFADDTVSCKEEIHKKVEAVAKRFAKARELAILNTRLYLSIVNELDVYVATSMRKRSDFRDMNRDTARIFSQEGLRALRIRYFDPTISAADGHEDKGLIECLMVKCAKALIYFAGEEDSFGKDAEVSMALSLGKPVIILCPATDKGVQRMKFFRDIHPLSRLIQMNTGIPVGAMITNDPLIAARLLQRIFENQMEYDLELTEDGYIRLTERLTQSVIRLQTNFQMLRESFANYYHHVG